MADPAKAFAGTQVVTITAGATNDDVPTVDLQPVRIPKGGKVQWHLKGGKSFRITFVGDTPFDSHYEFTGTAGSDAVSTVATVDRSKTKQYTYLVNVDGGRALDPDVIVDP